jgi:hypothetical protein
MASQPNPSSLTGSIKLRLLVGLKPVLVILGWSTSLAALTLQAIFSGQLIPGTALSQGGNVSNPYATDIFYIGIFLASVLAAMVIDDAGKAIISLLVAYLLTDVLVYAVIALPGFLGLFKYREVLVTTGITFAFAASFPLALIIELVATFVGIGLGERLQ